jgi:class 3 adenylate cyclase/CheY-like chemotaxis protein
LVAEDDPISLDVLRTRLVAHGYEVVAAGDGEAALAAARAHRPDLLLLDVMMPGLDGLEVCRRLRADASLPFFPIIMVTARTDSRDVVAGLDAGADEYLTKPLDHAALMARVRSMLRVKALHDTVQAQTAQLEAQAARLAEWNVTLQQRVEEQLAQLERVGRLRRFLSPQLAELVLSSGGEALLESHRRHIAVLYCDLRGSTAFAEAAEPEEVFGVLRAYQQAVGELITRAGATLEGFRGDGMIMFFNDPLPCPEPAAQAVRLALAMRRRLDDLIAGWRRRGHDLGFGVGIAAGYATLGQIGFDARLDYGSVGVVPNLAARLCDHAAPGQVLVSQRVYADVEAQVEAERLTDLTLKGFHRPVPAYNVLRLTADPAPGAP